MRISDWSSDVCSSDLGIQCSQVLAHRTRQRGLLGPLHISARHAALAVRVGLDDAGVGREPFAANELFGQATLQDLFEHESQGVVVAEPAMTVLRAQIGRASCRESVCQYVEIPVVAGPLKKKKQNKKK